MTDAKQIHCFERTPEGLYVYKLTKSYYDEM